MLRATELSILASKLPLLGAVCTVGYKNNVFNTAFPFPFPRKGKERKGKERKGKEGRKEGRKEGNIAGTKEGRKEGNIH